jgi:catechol 2,3-dioxygenase-like lactoylglutathione lyase family enzyme
MRLHSCVVIVRGDMRAMVEFYTHTLGRAIVADFGGCVIFEEGLSLWRPGQGHVVEPCARASHGHPFELCFETDETADFEKRAAAIQAAGVPLLHDVQVEPWGQRTIRLMDPEGNLIELGESIPCFVRRLRGEGLSLTEVAERTGVGLARVTELLTER